MTKGCYSVPYFREASYDRNRIYSSKYLDSQSGSYSYFWIKSNLLAQAFLQTSFSLERDVQFSQSHGSLIYEEKDFPEVM